MTAVDPSESPPLVDGYSIEAVITALYRGLLGRVPDPEGLQHHVEKAAAKGLAEVVRNIACSIEAMERSKLPMDEVLEDADHEGAQQDEAVQGREQGAASMGSYLEGWD